MRPPSYCPLERTYGDPTDPPMPRTSGVKDHYAGWRTLGRYGHLISDMQAPKLSRAVDHVHRFT